MLRFGDPGGRGYNAVGTNQINLLSWWPGNNSGPNVFTITAGGGRNGGNSLRMTTNLGTSKYVSRPFDSQPTWGIAFAIKLNTAQGVSEVFALYDGVTIQIDLRVNSDGTLAVTRNGALLGTTSGAVPFNAWTHVEWLSTIHNTAGTTQIWINGISALNLSAQNTRNTTNNSASVGYLGCPSVPNSNFICDLDDIIVYDSQANDPQGNADITGPIGDCSLTWLLPTGAGTTTQFTPDSGSNYARVNEATPDLDTSYVGSSTIGQIDTYQMADLPVSAASVKSIAAVIMARKDDAGTRGVACEIRTGGANFQGANQFSLGMNYLYYFNNWGRKPGGTPSPWSVADINAIEVGQNMVS
jgi:hypothetical protein